MNKNRNIFSIFHNIVESIFIAIIIAVILRIFFVGIFYIPSSSMTPTLKIGDNIIVWKFLYNNRIPVIHTKFPFGIKIRRGDVIVFIPPNSPEEDYVKRCIGLPGDKIKLIKSRVYVNGKLLNETYVKDKDLVFYDKKTYTVPQNHIFVMGDNRNNSSDSRDWGFVPMKNIIGKAVFIFIPARRMGVIK